MGAVPGSTGPAGLTRGQVAQRLGVSVSTVRRMEFHQLHPVRSLDGKWRFDPAEVDAMERRTNGVRPAALTTGAEARHAIESHDRSRRGRLAARLFRVLERRLSLPQIVATTAQPPEVVRALYHEWSTSLEEGEWERCRDPQ